MKFLFNENSISEMGIAIILMRMMNDKYIAVDIRRNLFIRSANIKLTTVINKNVNQQGENFDYLRGNLLLAFCL